MIFYPIDPTKLNKSGGKMTGDIDINTHSLLNIGKIILTEDMYGTNPPSSAVEGQLFFQIIE